MDFASVDMLFDEIIDFLVSSPKAEQLVHYQPPANLQQRLIELLDKNRSGQLSDVETQEISDVYVVLSLLTKGDVRI